MSSAAVVIGTLRVKCWPADLVVPSSIPAGGNVLNHKQGFIAYSLWLSPSHHPDMTEIPKKRM